MKPLIFIGVVVVGVVSLAVAAGIYDQNQWNDFSAAHDCKLVGHKNSTVGYGLTPSGKMGTVILPEENSYLCDDGVTYTR